MTNIQITNGVVKYERNIKTADFEGKKASVELSFNVPDGEEAGEHIAYVTILAENHVHAALGLDKTKSQVTPTAAAPAKTEAAPATKPAPAAKGKAKVAKKAVDPASVEEEEPEDDSSNSGDGLDDLFGLNEALAEITDKALNDAVQKQQDAVKNAPAIRKLLNEFGIKTPPGRLIDLEQSKRADFIAKLQLIKPLA